MSDPRDSDLDLGAAHLRPAQRGPDRRSDRQRPAPEAAVIPWEGLRRDGLAAAFAATWWRLVSSPTAAFATVPRERGPGRAWTFALLCGAIFGVVSELVDSATVAMIQHGGGSLGSVGLLRLDIAGRSLEWLPMSVLSLAGCLLALLVVAPLFVLFYCLLIGIWTGVVHLMLRLVGALAVSTTGWRGTLRAVCYSQVAMAGAIVPWLGDPIAVIWSFVLQVGGLARLHGCSRARAALAVALPAAALVAALVLLLLFADSRNGPPV